MSRLGGREESFKVLKRGLGRSPSRKSILLNFVYFFALDQLVRSTTDSRTATASVPVGSRWAIGPTWTFVRSGQGPTGHLVEIQMVQALALVVQLALPVATNVAACRRVLPTKQTVGGLHSPDSTRPISRRNVHNSGLYQNYLMHFCSAIHHSHTDVRL